MKIENSDTELHSSRLGESHVYKVAQNAQIMKMLADNVYSDKVLAPIRELSTNALDGHTKGGNVGQPFDVYLPTRLSPTFRIRDYGCGMDREQLTKMYTTYGESDKNDSNDFNGCMGIGSKSPFAYAQSFTTTSYHNGKKYVCINSKNEEDIPVLQFVIDGVDTDEPNGIDISFAVKANDVYKFEEAAQRLYRHFPVMPNIKTGVCVIPEREYLYEGKNWRILAHSGESVAVMGWIEYPVATKHFSKHNDDNYYWRRQDDTPEAQLLSMGIEMDFEIGEVEMDMARESLQYNKKSIDNIKARLKEILAFLKAEMSKSFDDCESLWDARVRYQDLTSGKMQTLQKLMGLQKPEYNGVDLSKSVDLGSLTGCHFVKFRNDGLKKARRTDKITDYHPSGTSTLSKFDFYENDMKRGEYSACDRVVMDSDTDCHTVYLCKFDDDTARQNFIDEMGWLDDSFLKKTSSAPQPSAKARAAKENVFKYRLDKATTGYTSSRYAKDWWKPEKVEFSDGGVFVEINAFRCRSASGSDRSSNEIGQMIKLLEVLGVAPPSEVVGIKTVAVKKYRKSKDWVDVLDWVKEKFNAYLKANKVGELIANIQELESFQGDKYRSIIKIANGGFDKRSPLHSFWAKVEELEKVKASSGTKCSSAQKLANIMRLDLAGDAKYNLENEEAAILNRYGMLEVIESWDVRNHGAKIVSYVNLIDKCEGI